MGNSLSNTTGAVTFKPQYSNTPTLVAGKVKVRNEDEIELGNGHVISGKHLTAMLEMLYDQYKTSYPEDFI